MSLPALLTVLAGALVNSLHAQQHQRRRRRHRPSLAAPGATRSSLRLQCGLTPRSTLTRYGRPPCPRGALASSCAARASRPASAVRVNSNVRPQNRRYLYVTAQSSQDRHSSLLLDLPMSMLFRVATAILGIALVSAFLWGFWGYVQSGSSGPPPQGRGSALLVGGLGYLLVLALAASEFPAQPSDQPSSFWRSPQRNLLVTVVALLACFPAAFLFIGFVAPPFILIASASALLASAFVAHPSTSKS